MATHSHPAVQPKRVFKIMTRDAWEDAAKTGQFAGSADDLRDGFIHLSAAHQVAGTLARHFKAQADLVLVAYETHSLGRHLKFEVSRGGDSFPHLYAPLPVAPALWHKPIATNADGNPAVANIDLET